MGATDQARASRGRGRTGLAGLLARVVATAMLFGPGILAMAGDNDAGGLLAYAATGARFGTRFFVPLLLPLGVMTFAVQEMATRLAVGTGLALPELVRAAAGRTWARLIAIDLGVMNTATLVSEVAGMAVGLAHFGVPVPVGAGISFVVVGAVLLLGSYGVAERIGLSLVVVNILFIPLALAHLPHPADLLPWPAGAHWLRPAFVLYAVGMAGNAMAPWMPFFQMDAVRAHGWTQPSDLRAARRDLLLGTLVQILVAMAVTVVAAAVPVGGTFAPGQWLAALGLRTSPWVADVFAVGLFDAGFVASITVSYASVWTVLRTWRGSGPVEEVEQAVSRSPLAAALFGGGLLLAAALVALPGAPLGVFAVATQALSAVLMPPIVLVLWALASRRRLLGPLTNGLASNATAAVALAVFVLASISLLLPGGM